MPKELNDHIKPSKEANLDRLEELQIAHCFEIMEHLAMVDIGHNAKLPFKERLQAMIMVNTIRKDAKKGKDDSDNAGSAVRKYSKSFADAASRRTSVAGSDADNDDAVPTGQPS